MPNIKSAIKRVKVIEKKTLENSMVKSALKTQIKKFDDTLSSQDSKSSTEALSSVFKAIDQAASKGILHKNTASRKKSSLARKLNQAK